MPLWPELAVRHIYPQAMRIPGLNSYMPDEWNHARRVDRKFFWALLSTLHADYV